MSLYIRLIAVFFSAFASVYNLYKLSNKKPNFKNLKLYIMFIILMFIAIFVYVYTNAFLRILLITIVLIMFYKILFKESIQKSLVTPITSQIIIMISEMVFVFAISLLLGMNGQDIMDTQFGQILSNLIISIISIVIVNLPITGKFYKLLVDMTDRLKNKQLIILSFIVILIANLLSATLYYKIEFKYLLVFNTLLTLFCFSIVLYSFKTKNNYIKVNDKYNTTLNSLKEYEDIIDRYRVSNHENKNQLLTIRNMVNKIDKDTISYIDKILNNKQKDDDKVMLEVSVIPTGGLRGIIYSKLLSMKEYKIEYELEISNEVKTVDLINRIDDSTMLDICRIIGVYIDNAIDEVKSLKEKYVNIEMYLDSNYLIISISNNYKGKIEINKLEDKGYTTKEKGHGYGLTLTKQIIDGNKKLSNEKQITKNRFTQILKIKM